MINNAFSFNGINDKKEYPLVSICIPTYNAVSTISVTIESILNQSYQNIGNYYLDNVFYGQ